MDSIKYMGGVPLDVIINGALFKCYINLLYSQVICELKAANQIPDHTSSGYDPEQGMCEVSKYLGVVGSNLGPLRLLYSTALCAVEENKDPQDLASFVQLKTCPDYMKGDKKKLYENRFQNWWAQSYLSGTKKQVTGFRDDTGIAHTLKTYDVDAMPKDCNKTSLEVGAFFRNCTKWANRV